MRLPLILLCLQLWGNVQVSLSQDAKSCELPDNTPNGYYQIIYGEGFVVGTTIKYFCNEGYQMVSMHDTRTCFLGKWTNQVPVCGGKSCGVPDDTPNGYYQIILGEGFVVGTTIKYFCNAGYQMVSTHDTRTCSLGKWTNHVPVCDYINCKVEVIHPHLSVIGLPAANEAMKTGHTLQFQCNEQHVLEGSKEIECLQTGQWSAPFPSCSEQCKVSELPNNVNLDTYVQSSRLNKGQKLRFSCRLRGQYLQGNEEVECLAGGQWSGAFPTCGAPVGCGSPPYLPDGDTESSLKFRYTHGESVKYICQNLYEMSGGPYKTCQNGQWIGEMRCLKPCTVDTDLMRAHNIAFKYGHASKLYAPHNDRLEFQCVGNTRHDGRVSMAQRCFDGVINLPTCL